MDMRGEAKTRTPRSGKRGAAPARNGKSPRSRALTAALARFGLDRDALDPDVVEAFATLAAESEAREERIENAELRVAELERLADSDSLPGVLNRRAFTRELQRVLAMAERHGARAALVFADLDGLKKINDAKGHLAGDAALAHVARVILANTRRTDIVGRLGGDEFGVILAESDVSSARKKAAALADLAAADPVGDADNWRGPKFTTRLSCGVVEIRKGATVEETLSLADSAMYRMKKAR